VDIGLKRCPCVEKTMPYGRNNTGNKNVSAQKALLANKLNFGSPSKTAPQTPPRAKKSEGLSYNYHGKVDGGGGKPKGVSKDPNFAANRAAIAGKISFGGQQKPASNAKGALRPTNPIPKPSGGKEFQNQKAALAAKLNFRPPLPPGDPRGKPSNTPPATAARSKPKPKPPPLGWNESNGSGLTNQKAALASKLVFRPPPPASPQAGGPKLSPPRPATEMPFSPKPPAAVDNMGLASQAAAVASAMTSYNPEDVTTTSSSDATSLQDARSVRSVDPPREPEMSFERGHSIRKDNPPPADPEMKYVRSYRIGGAEEPKDQSQVTPKDKVAGGENGLVQVVLIDEKYEWGTRPLNKRYQQNRVVVKRFTTNDEEERKRQRNKNGRGCTVM